ncbi:MAG: hypothetical protein KZQ92_20200 [Candidatus Thiodiazotropha sp. (ex Lucinoma borealis)]|nr:hypothetical protein [Candidatus Thiodiazotropha sp. (ex Lucinoma borealis)]MCU7866286.1 hypothetical protein [Candidatus Thiodiazotropha sp. (ex Lucinoma borealis)]MCU7868234.1 hypothetical protein [Candidatus Thiodiazotropha sp. (ex Lucinoma borealis)]
MKYTKEISDRASSLRKDWEKRKDIRLIALDAAWMYREQLMYLAQPNSPDFAVFIISTAVAGASHLVCVPDKVNVARMRTISQEASSLIDSLQNDTLSMLLLGGPDDPDYYENSIVLNDLLSKIQFHAAELSRDEAFLSQWFVNTSQKATTIQTFSMYIWQQLNRHCSVDVQKSPVAKYCCEIIHEVSRDLQLKHPNQPAIEVPNEKAIRGYFS